MNTSELKRAAEVMTRAANGEVVECLSRAKTDSQESSWVLPLVEVKWQWSWWDYRILDFPEPPKGQQWHNPHKLTATQVGVHEGWRLLLSGESFPEDCEVFAFGSWAKTGLGWKKGVKTNEAWNTNWAPKDSLRTKAPLPPTLPTTAEEAWPKFLEEIKKLDVMRGEMEALRYGWSAAVEYMNSLKDKS